MQKINFINDTTPALNATNLNKLQQNVEDVTGDLTELETSAKTNLVAAINEAKRSGGDAVPIHSIFDYDGDTVPTGYEEVEETEDYSTSETNTGKKWIDDKPIYRKVLNLGSVNWNSTPKTFTHNISNLDTGIKVEWFGFLTTVNKWYMNWDAINTKNILISTTNVEIQNTAADATFSKNYIILEYTKTTDGGNS